MANEHCENQSTSALSKPVSENWTHQPETMNCSYILCTFRKRGSECENIGCCLIRVFLNFQGFLFFYDYTVALKSQNIINILRAYALHAENHKTINLMLKATLKQEKITLLMFCFIQFFKTWNGVESVFLAANQRAGMFHRGKM